MDPVHSWQPHLGGSTLGMEGAAGGTIRRDESLAGDLARLTLEEDAARSFYAVTCTLPDWLVHTRYFSTPVEALAALEEMRPALEALVLQLPPARERPAGEQTRRAGAHLAAFLARFP